MQQFNPTMLTKSNIHLIVIGKRATGKTTLLMDLYQKIGKPIVRVFTHNEKEWNHLVTSENACQTVDNTLCIVDDLPDFSWPMNGQKRPMWVSMAYPQGIRPEFRENIDYLFLFKDTHLGFCKKIYEMYCSNIFPSFEDFYALFEKYTQEFQCLVIHLKSNSEEKVFWYVGPNPDDNFLHKEQ